MGCNLGNYSFFVHTKHNRVAIICWQIANYMACLSKELKIIKKCFK